MASILQTDVIELFNTWGERVAINERVALFEEGYIRARESASRSSGAEAFRSGVSLDDAVSDYRENLAFEFAEAEFPRNDSVNFIDDLGEVDDLGSVADVADVDVVDDLTIDFGFPDNVSDTVLLGDESEVDLDKLYY